MIKKKKFFHILVRSHFYLQSLIDLQYWILCFKFICLVLWCVFFNHLAIQRICHNEDKRDQNENKEFDDYVDRIIPTDRNIYSEQKTCEFLANLILNYDIEKNLINFYEGKHNYSNSLQNKIWQHIRGVFQENSNKPKKDTRKKIISTTRLYG